MPSHFRRCCMVVVSLFWIFLAAVSVQAQPGPAFGTPGSAFGVPGSANGNRAPVKPLPPTTQPADIEKAKTLTFQPVVAVPVQAAALAVKIDVDYRRDFPLEVFQDLARRTELRYALPGPIYRDYLFTLQAKQITVKEVLEKLAAAGNAQIEFQPPVAVLTRTADDQSLAQLTKKLASADRWERIHALWDLGNLADPRIYAPLLQPLSDADEGVVEWTLRAWQGHALMVTLLPEAQRETLAAAIVKWLARTDLKTMPNAMFAWGMSAADSNRGMDLAERLRLLAATHRPSAEQTLAHLAVTSDPESNWVRPYAMQAMGEFGVAPGIGAAALLAFVRASGQIIAERGPIEEAQLRLWREKFQQPRDPKKPVENYTAPKLDPMLAEARIYYRPAFAALITMRDPQGIKEACIAYMSQPDVTWGVAGQALRVSGDSQVYGLIVPRHIKAIDPLLAATTDPDSDQMARGSAVVALAGAHEIRDPRVAALVVRIIQSDAALGKVVATAGMGGFTHFEATEASIVEALLKRVNANKELGVMVARSLGTTRDTRAADALILLLHHDDKLIASEAAGALGATRDSRAFKGLGDLLAEKIDWPDLQQIEWDKMKQGKPGRLVLNPRKLVLLGWLLTRDPGLLDRFLSVIQDVKANEETREFCQMYLGYAAPDSAPTDKLVKAVQQLPPEEQYSSLFFKAKTNALEPVRWRVTFAAPHCLDDPRWPGMIAARAKDDAAWAFRADGVTPMMNWASNALGQILTPESEQALIELSIIKTTKDVDVSEYATKALGKFRDPLGVAQANKP